VARAAAGRNLALAPARRGRIASRPARSRKIKCRAPARRPCRGRCEKESVMLPKFIYLNQSDKSDPLNVKRVMCLKWGDFYVKLSWYTARLKFNGGRVSRIPLFS
jgi:hypothetical protein